MSKEENKVIMRRWIEEGWNQQNEAVADEFYAPDFANDLKEFVKQVFAAFPDFHITIEDQVAEGDKVVTRYSTRGTHKGTWMGIAPTGVEVQGTGINISRISGGKVVEDWQQDDNLGVFQQLGVIPPLGEGEG
jgi:predicted ester cyclase